MLQQLFNFVWSWPVNLACYLFILAFFGSAGIWFITRAIVSAIQYRRDCIADRQAIMARRALPWHQR